MPVRPYGLSLWIGVALVLDGRCGVPTRRHLPMLKELRAGESLFAHGPRLAVGMAAALMLPGWIMAGIRFFANPNAVVLASMIRKEFMAISMPSPAGNGILRLPSNHSVDETVAKLQGILQAKGVKLFAVVDHSGEASSAGLKMPNTKLLIFGSPKAGTPLMLSTPTVALDLPLKILVAEDNAGETWILYNAPVYLQTRHGFPADLLANIAVIEALAAKAAE